MITTAHIMNTKTITSDDLIAAGAVPTSKMIIDHPYSPQKGGELSTQHWELDGIDFTAHGNGKTISLLTARRMGILSWAEADANAAKLSRLIRRVTCHGGSEFWANGRLTRRAGEVA